MTVDPFTLEICRNRLDSIVQEMATALIKTSSSPTTTETKDFSTSLFDYKGRQLAFSGYILYHASSNWEGIQAIIRDYPLEEIHEGDVFIANDPCYGGGIHPGDVCIFMPHFVDGKIAGYSACASHQIDVGGGVPGGWNCEARENFAEALLLPPVKVMRKGEIDRSMWMLLMNNIRMPDRVGLDFKGLISSNIVAGKRITELGAAYGYDNFVNMQEEIHNLSEKSVRKRISEFADGTYSTTDWIENNGHDEGAWKIHCELKKEGDQLFFDYNKSDPQTDGFVNCGPSGLSGGVMVNVLQMIGYDIPYNDGFLRPIHFLSDEGKIVKASKPAPIGAGHMNATLKIQEVSMASINKMFAASKSPWRERSMGVWGDQWGLHLCHGLNREGNFEIYINMDGGGCGGAAYSTRDGIPVAGCPQQCGMDLPDVEFNEMNFPLFFQYKKLKKNSGGPGKFRGGLGLEYSWSIYGVKEMTNVIFYQRRAVPQIGMFGAPLVSTSKFVHVQDSDILDRFKNKKTHPQTLDDTPGDRYVTAVNDSACLLSDKDVFYVTNLGGSGWGDPIDRDSNLVLKDFLDGWIDEDQALKVYGVVFNKEKKSIDLEQTNSQRSKIRENRLKEATGGSKDYKQGSEEAIVFDHSPLIKVGKYDGKLMYQCASTQTIFGPVEKNWKELVPVIERKVDENYLKDRVLDVGIRKDQKQFIVREYISPKNGTQLEVELALEGSTIEYDSKPAHYGV